MLKRRVIDQLAQRATWLPREIASWRQGAAANLDNLGMHRSQLEALGVLMSERFAIEGKKLQALHDLSAEGDLGASIMGLLRELAATEEVWSMFQQILFQHENRTYRAILRIADHVAADCVRSCQEQMINQKARSASSLPAPPLTCLHARPSPLAVARGRNSDQLGETFGASGQRYSELPLPIPIVLVPFDHCAGVWNLCSLHHEAGHVLDWDIGLRGVLGALLETEIDAHGIPAERKRYWLRWVPELLADAFGVLLGGRGFVDMMAGMLLVSRERAATLGEGAHPAEYLRPFILGSLLEKVPPGNTGSYNKVAESWRGVFDEPPWATAFLGDIPVVTELLINRALAPLGNRPLCDLVDEPEYDAIRINALAEYFATGQQAPDALQEKITMRMLPPAAELALSIGTVGEDRLQTIHARAIAYSEQVVVPKWLGEGDSHAHYKSLASRDLAGWFDSDNS